MPFERTPALKEIIFAPAGYHIDLADDVVLLANFARVAFALGMVDAFEHRTIKDSDAVMRYLFPHGWTGGSHHREKFRMVYGAGQSMARWELHHIQSGTTDRGGLAESHLTRKGR
jgi:hypothetical protein